MSESRKREISEQQLGNKRQKFENGSSAKLDAIAQAKAKVKALMEKKKKLGLSQATELLTTNDDSTTAKTSSNGLGAKPKIGIDDLARIRERRAQLQSSVQKSASNTIRRVPQSQPVQQLASTVSEQGVGLNIQVHPLLLEREKPASETTSKMKKDKNLDLYFQPVPVEDGSSNPYFDSSIGTGKQARKTRGLVFNRHGKYIEKGQDMRRQLQEELVRKQQIAKSNEGLVETNILGGEREYKPSPPPDFEWWDEVLLNDKSYDEVLENKLPLSWNEVITSYIQHPMMIGAPWEKSLPIETKLHMTKKETKRLRKNTRAEKFKELQDRIRLGLDPAPPPKIKPSNVMSVYANEAIRDPTLMERKARQEVEQRKLKHEQENQSRKLTPEQQYEKFAEKLEKEKSKGMFTAVFRIENLSDNKHRYIVNYNANKFQFTGITIFNPKFNLVVIEGGFLPVKKYTKMLLSRVKWTEGAPPRTEEEQREKEPQDLSQNKCTLVWYGQLKTNKFVKWTLRDTETEQDAKDILSRNDAENYWVEARVVQE